MICPIKQLAYAIAPIQTNLTNRCDEEDCSWWITYECGCCSITAIAQLLELARQGNFGG